MKKITIDRLNLNINNGEIKLSANICDHQRTTEVWFKTNNQNLEINQSGNPFIPVVLFDAMIRGLNISLQIPVSDKILASARKVQLVRYNWDCSWKMIKFEQHQELTSPQSSNSRKAVGLFFSGGVDSFYTLKKHKDEITHLIFVHGFDIPVSNSKFSEIVSSRLRQIADKLNLEFVEVKTNLRKYSAPLINCEEQFGAGHPLLINHFSSAGVQIQMEDDILTRVEKLKILADWQPNLNLMQPCHQIKVLPPEKINCGYCEKCVRTMLGLLVIGKLAQARAFTENDVTPKMINDIPVATRAKAHHLQLTIKPFSNTWTKLDNALISSCFILRESALTQSTSCHGGTPRHF